MIAKLILNEIKRGENSALGSIGVGSITFTTGYKSIKDKFPYWNPKQRAVRYGDNTRDLVLMDMEKWAYTCPSENILVIENTSTPMGMDNWIDDITENLWAQMKDLNIEFNGKRYSLHQKYFKDLNIGKVTIMYEKNGEVDTDNYYLIRYQ